MYPPPITWIYDIAPSESDSWPLWFVWTCKSRQISSPCAISTHSTTTNFEILNKNRENDKLSGENGHFCALGRRHWSFSTKKDYIWSKFRFLAITGFVRWKSFGTKNGGFWSKWPIFHLQTDFHLQFPGENGIFVPKLFPGGHFGPKMVFFDTFWSLETTTDQLFYDGPGWVIRFLWFLRIIFRDYYYYEKLELTRKTQK